MIQNMTKALLQFEFLQYCPSLASASTKWTARTGHHTPCYHSGTCSSPFTPIDSAVSINSCTHTGGSSSPGALFLTVQIPSLKAKYVLLHKGFRCNWRAPRVWNLIDLCKSKLLEWIWFVLCFAISLTATQYNIAHLYPIINLRGYEVGLG